MPALPCCRIAGCRVETQGVGQNHKRKSDRPSGIVLTHLVDHDEHQQQYQRAAQEDALRQSYAEMTSATLWIAGVCVGMIFSYPTPWYRPIAYAAGMMSGKEARGFSESGLLHLRRPVQCRIGARRLAQHPYHKIAAQKTSTQSGRSRVTFSRQTALFPSRRR